MRQKNAPHPAGFGMVYDKVSVKAGFVGFPSTVYGHGGGSAVWDSRQETREDQELGTNTSS